MARTKAITTGSKTVKAAKTIRRRASKYVDSESDSETESKKKSTKSSKKTDKGDKAERETKKETTETVSVQEAEKETKETKGDESEAKDEKKSRKRKAVSSIKSTKSDKSDTSEKKTGEKKAPGKRKTWPMVGIFGRSDKEKTKRFSKLGKEFRHKPRYNIERKIRHYSSKSNLHSFSRTGTREVLRNLIASCTEEMEQGPALHANQFEGRADKNVVPVFEEIIKTTLIHNAANVGQVMKISGARSKGGAMSARPWHVQAAMAIDQSAPSVADRVDLDEMERVAKNIQEYRNTHSRAKKAVESIKASKSARRKGSSKKGSKKARKTQ